MDTTTYSCRAEFDNDINTFLQAMGSRSLAIEITERKPMPIGGAEIPGLDTMIEFTSETTLEGLREVLRAEDDLHVMAQSLRPLTLGENSLERDDTVH